MKLKFKLSIMVIAILTVVVAGVSILLLSKASNISIDLNRQVMKFLSGEQAEYWKGRRDAHLRMISTIADIMADYSQIPEGERRDTFDRMLYGTLTSQPNIQQIYTIWLPNAVDGMDAQMIGRAGSSPSGQYAVAYSREKGSIEAIFCPFLDSTMEWLTGPDAKKQSIPDPFFRDIQGDEMLMVRMVTPIIDSQTNQVVGAVGMLMDVEMMQPILADTIKANDEIAAMVIYSNDGTILAHTYPDRIGKNLREVDTVYGDYMEEAIKAIAEGEAYHCSSYSEVMDLTLEIFLTPFKLGNSDTTWSIMVAATDAYILSEVRDITRFTVILAVIIIAVVAFLIYFVLNLTMKPVVNVAETLKDIAEGEGDLTRIIPEKGKDEITDLSRYFNQTLAKIRNLVTNIRDEARKLSGIGTELASNMNETAAAVNQITANIQSIKGRIINQSASVTQTNATMEQVTININKLNDHIEDQNNCVTQASSAIQEMVANTHSVTGTLVKNSTNVKQLKEASEIGHDGLQEVASDIQDIAGESEGLLEINSVMANIASQTNLLSMNAAIEAAHAGEAGKGFAVVADEIRKLAESSSEQSKTIGVVLKKIKGSIDKISSSTGNVLNRFEAIDSSINTVAQQEESIRNAMEVQEHGSKQVLDGIERVNDITKQVKTGSSEMLEGSQEVIRESHNLEKATQEITSGMNEMASGADQINIAVNQVNEITIKNREGIEALLKEVSRFKIE
ncbi:MAG: methyl-accepting chemotaxis protein [Treponema sp.]|nr:methyl-accepting chemotaxis protein [Treponema sp.]MCL2237968.1 methyl-accepting chemotaxis protein [Treponema sp.]